MNHEVLIFAYKEQIKSPKEKKRRNTMDNLRRLESNKRIEDSFRRWGIKKIWKKPMRKREVEHMGGMFRDYKTMEKL